YVLRYWEQEFTQLRPMKRRGNRRYYQHHEVLLIRRIRDLLYEQGFTISGARNRLLDNTSPAPEDDHLDADLADDLPDAPGDVPIASNGLAHEPVPLVVEAVDYTGSLDEPVNDQPVISGHVQVPVDLPAVIAPILQPHTLPTSAALLRQELELIRDLLDTGANDQFADILSVSVGA
ncbi:MAG: hypothetical protein RL375_1979, partial [Pseudomonadota bacterium]